MYLNFKVTLCTAILLGLLSTSQTSNKLQNGDIGFNEESFEGSGTESELTRDLEESSGSGQGPDDDEDTPLEPQIPNKKLKVGKTPMTEEPSILKNNPNPAHDTDTNSNNNYKNHNNNNFNSPSEEETHVKMDPRPSFFAQPGILAAVIGGAVVGLLCAILVVMFIVYRMRKKDEGSYSLGEPKPSHNINTYNRGNEKEFYA